MKLVPFDPDDAEAMVALLALYESWGHPEACPSPDELPDMGFIVPGVAAMFLYEVNANWCFLEHAITMRHHPDRQEAIHALVQGLMVEAKELGFVKVYVNVGNEAAIARAEACGFVKKGEPYRCQLEREVDYGEEQL